MTDGKTPQLDTPAMRQYRQFKRQYADYMLLFRMGDFYEMFYDDAREASRILGLTLTSRSKGPTAVPLAGIPYHALDSYLARLVAAGVRVAICEQVEDAREAKGLVKRDVTRLVTPGTLTDETLLDQREGNYLAALMPPDRKSGLCGLAWIELSSGTFRFMDLKQDQLLDEVTRIRPAEALVPQGGMFDDPAYRSSLRQCCGAVCTVRPSWAFEAAGAQRTLHEHFGVNTLAGFGVSAWTPGVSAAGAIIEYLRETQKTSLGHILALRPVDRGEYMQLDGVTLRSLEVKRTLRAAQRAGSLLGCLDRTRTGMGSRLLENWITFPLKRYSGIVARQDAVEQFVGRRDLCERLRELLGECSQIDRITANIALGRVRPRELVRLAQTLRLLPEIYELLADSDSEIVCHLRENLPGMDQPAELLRVAIDPDCPNTLRDGGVIASGFNEELDRLRGISVDGQRWLAEYQAEQARATGIPSLRVGFNKVFGYYLEVTHAHADKVPDGFVRKQTLKNAERYITDELKRYETEVLTAGERIKALENQLYEQLREHLEGFCPQFQAAGASLATLDVLTSLAELAVERRWKRPVMTQDNVLEIIGGRHPVLDEQLREKFIPNDTHLGPEADRVMVITGPNMAGKSTYIRQNALLVLLAQTGSFIPADSATVGLVDRIFTRVGAADELTEGLSTFMVEMVETANILNNATSRSLVILDEVGRGTSTYDGLSLAWAITEHLAAAVKCRTFFATHYHELTELAGRLTCVKNLNVAVREWADEVVFLHRIVEGGTDRSYGVYVAKLAGVPKAVVERAKELLSKLQSRLADGLDMPKFAASALREADQMRLFEPADRTALEDAARQIRELNPDAVTPMQAHEMLRRLKEMLD